MPGRHFHFSQAAATTESLTALLQTQTEQGAIDKAERRKETDMAAAKKFRRTQREMLEKSAEDTGEYAREERGAGGEECGAGGGERRA